MSEFLLWLCHFRYYRLGGWTAKPEMPDGVKKAVVLVAPHTANRDFPIGLGLDYLMKPRGQFLAKKELFDGALGWVFKLLGGIPVDRSKKNNFVDEVSRIFNEREELFVVIAPEGTRSRTTRWKTGFYHMAKGANVPIVLAYIDYGKKECGFGKVLYPSDDMAKDFSIIEDFYRSVTAHHPEKFNPKMVDESTENR
ncbi:MAG: 1-acyl-sn-glycerol-3-phosphate acyltransferase [Bacteroidia bacterium]|jgi:1-acyl-sn-glycerol-3-phosphate acyltransferase